MRVTRTRAEARSLIERQQHSGLSVRAFCEQESLTAGTFYYWRKRLRASQQAESTTFAPVCFSHQADRGSVGPCIELTYPNGVRISLPAGSSLPWIHALIGLG